MAAHNHNMNSLTQIFTNVTVTNHTTISITTGGTTGMDSIATATYHL